MELTSGNRLGIYEILGLFGAGGMGRVYRACDLRLDRPVAIKVLRDDWAQNPDWLARFEREARLLAAALLEPDGTLHPIPAAFDGDLYPAGWTKGGKVLGMGYPFHRAVWQLRLPTSAGSSASERAVQ